MNKTAPKTTTKKKARKSYSEGRVYINAHFNNTLVTLTSPTGEVLAWCTPGACGFKGARQSTPYAGQLSAEKIAEKIAGFGMELVDVYLKGMGPARDQSVRGLINGGVNIRSIVERSRLPHGGCRPKRQRKP